MSYPEQFIALKCKFSKLADKPYSPHLHFNVEATLRLQYADAEQQYLSGTL